MIAGRYRLISALGNGGMGTVWLAEDDLLSRQVAVKEVSPPADMTEHERELLRERTLREARTAARLSHPNVVTIYDVVEDDGRPWIVMEVVPSRSLREMVDAEGPLSARQAAGVGLQVLAALKAAHALGIMHRDVKPGNVLIAADGRAVLADFGIARTQDSTALTTSGVLVGSPSYIAPERARGERGGPESDLWSLGATLYALVEGRPAYDRAGPLPILMAVVNEDPDPPSRAGVLWPVIRGLLDHVPSRRLGPDEAERMLRQVAEAPGGSKTTPFPAVPPPAASSGTVQRTRAESTLESAEHTVTLRPWDGVAPAEAGAGLLAVRLDAPLDEPGRAAVPKEPASEALPDQPEPDALPEEPGADALPDQPDPDALPEEPGAHALPEQPDPDALRDQPDRDAPPDQPESGALPEERARPEEPDPHAFPDDPGSFVEPEAGPLPREPEPTALAEARDAAEPAAVATEERAPQPTPERASEADAIDAGLIPGLRGWSGSARTTRQRSVSPRRRRRAWILAAAVGLILVAGAVVSLIVTSHRTALATPNPRHPTARASSSPSAGRPTPTSSAPTTSPPSSPAATPTSTSGSGSGAPVPAVIPDGYHKFVNSTGFSIAVPDGWRVSHQGHYVYLIPPSGAEFLLIDQSEYPQPNPLKDWQQQEANRESTYPGYHRIRLEAVNYPQAEKAADWEFTYFRQGVLLHVLNRNILANSHHAYALYWSTPDREWGRDWHTFKILAQTFRPASP